MSVLKRKPLTVNDILPYMGKTKRKGRETVGECPLCHKKDHLYVSDGNGKLLVHCHHCNAPGGDIIKEFIRLGAVGEVIPDNAERTEVSRTIHNYCNPDGSLAYQKGRCKYSDGSKEFRYVWSEDGEKMNFTKPEGSINLYNLDKMAQADPKTILYIVEGEKCADAMAEHGFLATTGHCGAKKCIDFTLKDREMLDKFPVKVVIPDNDVKGEDYIKAWGNVYTLRMQQFWQDCPAKGDVADYFAQGGKAEDIKVFEKNFSELADLDPDNIAKIDNLDYLMSPSVMEVLWQNRENAYEKERLFGLFLAQAGKLKGTQSFKNAWRAYQQQKARELTMGGLFKGNKSNVAMQPIEINTGEWTVDDKGISKLVKDSNGIPYSQVICRTPMLPREILNNIEEQIKKARISYKNDGKWNTATFPCGILASQTKILQLADLGIAIDSNNAKTLTGYFTDAIHLNEGIIPQNQSVSHLGWNSLGFVPYSDEIVIDTGKDMETLVNSVNERGTLDEWVEFVRPLRENIIVRLAIAAAFASPLIEICGTLPFMTHIWGGSGTAKTVTLMVAASVWGNPNAGRLVRSMNMTLNNLMTVAATLYSIPLYGDELQTIKNKDGSYDQLIMRYTEGIDRGRNKDGQTVQELKHWCNAFISTGEEPIISDHSGTGAANRVIEVECDELLIADGNATANFVRHHYGCAGKEFIAKLPPKEEIQDEYQTYFKDAIQRGNTTDKQAMSIALITLADKYSSEIIFGDQQANPESFYEFCKNVESIDQPVRAWEYVQDWIAANMVKFVGSLDHDYTGATWGKPKGEYMLVNKNVLCEALEDKGFVFNAVKKAWAKKGWLETYKNSYVFKDSVNGKISYYVHLKIENEKEG